MRVSAVIFSLALFGCAHNVAPGEVLADEKNNIQTPHTYPWHDGSTGGLYGVGDGRTIEIQNPEYKKVEELITWSSLTPRDSIVPAEYEWIEENSEDLSDDPILVKEIIFPPGGFETVKEFIEIEAAKKSYRFAEAVYDSDGTLTTPRKIQERVTPAVTKQREHLVPKYSNTVERMIPLERRRGYRRVLKTPAYTKKENPIIYDQKLETLHRIKRPGAFTIRNPDGEVAHVFDKYEDLTAFLDSLK